MSQWRHELTQRLDGLSLGPERAAEIIEELSQHLDDAVRELVAGGMDEARARDAALADLDTPGLLASRLAAVERRPPPTLPPPGAPVHHGWSPTALWRDVRYSTRALRRTPGFTATVIIALALTIGPTTAMLSIANWLLWRPTPGVAQADRVAVVWVGEWTGAESFSPRGVSYLDLADLRTWASTVSGIAGEQEGSGSVAIPGQPPEFRGVAWVTHDYFTVLDVRMSAGRALLPEDDQTPHGARVVVIADALARQAFGSPAAAVGETLLLNGLPMSVVGVAEPTFTGASPFNDVQVWYPGAAYPYVNRFKDEFLARYAARGDGIFYSFVTRLAPNATFEQAQAELDVLVARLAEEHPDENGRLATAGARLFPGLGPMPLMRAGLEREVTGLLIVGGLLLLLGCVNVANLLLVRGMQRQRDRAVRLSLGATRARLMQLQLVESCLLAVAGAAAGVGLAMWLKQVIFALMYPEAIVQAEVPLDARVLSATLGLAVLCGLLAGLAPAWIGSSRRLARTLGDLNARTTPAGAWLRTTFASTQLALSLMLLTGALLMVQTVRDLRGLDVGLDPAGVSVHYLPLESHGYTVESAMSYHAQVLEALTSTPGIEAASLSEGHPFGSGSRMRVQRLGDTGEPTRVFYNEVTPDYFRLLRIPVLQGRSFTGDEAMRAASAGGGVPVVVSQSLGRQLYGDESPLGQRLESPDRPRELVVVGVAGDAQWRGLIDTPEPVLYFPFRQGTSTHVLRPVLMVRSSRPVDEVRRSVQGIMAIVDPSMPAMYGGLLAADIDGDGDISDRRVLAWALSILSAIGVLLAGFGLVGLLGQIVSERTREFGIRLAIGARPMQLYAQLGRYAAWIAATGTVMGLGLAWFGSRLLESQLYGVSRFDLLTYVAAAGLLALVVLLASLWPGWTATRVDPIEALRAE